MTSEEYLTELTQDFCFAFDFDGGRFTATSVTARIGVKRPWVALVTGPDEKWGIKREFLNSSTVDSRHLSWVLSTAGLYSYGNFPGAQMAGLLVTNGCHIEEVTRSQAQRFIELLA